MKDAQNLTLPRAGAGASPKKSGAPRRKLSGGLRKAEVVMQGIFLVCGLIAVAFVLLISIYLIIFYDCRAFGGSTTVPLI